MKKLTIFFIATLLGVAIMSCSKHDETLSPNVGAQKTVQYDYLADYYEICINYFDEIESITDSLALIESQTVFNEQWNWLLDTTCTQTYSDTYLAVSMEILDNMLTKTEIPEAFVTEILNSNDFTRQEKMLLIYAVAQTNQYVKYNNCYVLAYDNRSRYCISSFVYDLVSSSSELKSEIISLRGTLRPESGIAIYSDGDTYHAVAKSYSWLSYNYNLYSQFLANFEECNEIYQMRLEFIRNEYHNDCAFVNWGLDHGRMSASDAKLLLEFALREYQRKLKIAEREYEECRKSVRIADVQVAVFSNL